MSGEPELPTASVVRSSQATPARRRGQLCTDVRPAGLHLSKPVPCSNNRSHLSDCKDWTLNFTTVDANTLQGKLGEGIDIRLVRK